MFLTVLFCALAFTTAKELEGDQKKLLDEISSTVINDMVKTLDSKDVLTIDATLRSATAKVQPRLRQLAQMMGVRLSKVARLVSSQVAKDKRIVNALAKRESHGSLSTRSSMIRLPLYVNNLVYKALTSYPD